MNVEIIILGPTFAVCSVEMMYANKTTPTKHLEDGVAILNVELLHNIYYYYLK